MQSLRNGSFVDLRGDGGGLYDSQSGLNLMGHVRQRKEVQDSFPWTLFPAGQQRADGDGVAVPDIRRWSQ